MLNLFRPAAQFRSVKPRCKYLGWPQKLNYIGREGVVIKKTATLGTIMQSEMWLNHVLLVSLSIQEEKKEKYALASSFKNIFTLVAEARAGS